MGIRDVNTSSVPLLREHSLDAILIAAASGAVHDVGVLAATADIHDVGVLNSAAFLRCSRHHCLGSHIGCRRRCFGGHIGVLTIAATGDVLDVGDSAAATAVDLSASFASAGLELDDTSTPSGHRSVGESKLQTFSRRAKCKLKAPILPVPDVQRVPIVQPTSATPRRSKRLAASCLKFVLAQR